MCRCAWSDGDTIPQPSRSRDAPGGLAAQFGAPAPMRRGSLSERYVKCSKAGCRCAEDPAARQWYVNEAVTQNWSSRALERQVSRLYYERLLSSKDRNPARTRTNASTSRTRMTGDAVKGILGSSGAG